MKIPKWLQPSVDFMKELAKEFSEDNSALMAAAVSFYVFLSLTPLLLLAAAAFGFILGSDQRAYQTVADFLTKYLPQQGAGSIQPILQEVVEGSSAATGFGIVTLLSAGTQAFANLEKTMNIAWDSNPRGFLTGRLIAVVLVIAVGVLLLISFGITTAASAIQTYRITLFGQNLTEWFGFAWGFLAYLLPLVVSIMTFTLIYKILPNTEVPWVSALVGGIVAGTLWEGAKYGFSWYVTNIANYSAVYGPLSSIIVLLFWIYYSSILAILGAQISSIYYCRRQRS